VTDGFHLDPPTTENLENAQRGWRTGTLRVSIPAETEYWRVLRAPSRADALSYAEVCYPSDANNRFSPVLSSGAPIPSAYAGASEPIALWEVVLRNIRHGGIKRVPRHETRDRYLVRVKTLRALELLDLRRPAISALVDPGNRPPDLSAAWPVAYETTRLWAQRLVERIPQADGFIYESHQVPGECIVLFQPTAPKVFATIGDAVPVDEGTGRKLLEAQARRANAVVDFGDLPDPPET